MHMGFIRQSLQARPKNIKKRNKSVKEPKIRMGATRRRLQAQPKILKKLSVHQIYQSERKFTQKSMLTLKKKRSQKFVWELPDFNPKKSLKHHIYQSERKFSLNNYVSYLKSVNEPKIRVGAT
jgi:hypothetical protein